MEPVKEGFRNYDQMLIVEKYERVIAYLYPIAQNLPRKHGVARDMFLQSLFGQVDLFVKAGKSNQISRCYEADAGLANLRFWLRFLADAKLRGMTKHQQETAQSLIAECGGILNKWIVNMKAKKGQ
jgi:hypothetical protein